MIQSPTPVAQAQQDAPTPSVPRLAIPGWTSFGRPESYGRGGLYGYIDGGAEIFLQYGFRGAAVLRFRPAGGNAAKGGAGAETQGAARETGSPAAKELTVEIYTMETPADAFGIFSVGRAGDEHVSERVEAENWIFEVQAALVKGDRYVNITASLTKEAELEAVAAAVAAALPGELNRGPSEFDLLPKRDQVRASRRYIRGELAANAEAPLLGADFWGFRDGPARAFTAKYGTSGSKLALVDLGTEREDLGPQVDALFREYLADVGRDGAVVSGNAIGRYFLFRQAGRFAALVLGETDPAAARARLDEALAGR